MVLRYNYSGNTGLRHLEEDVRKNKFQATPLVLNGCKPQMIYGYER